MKTCGGWVVRKGTSAKGWLLFSLLVSFLLFSCVSVTDGYCLEGDCLNGYGVKAWYTHTQVTSKYSGNWQDGQFHGEGTFVIYNPYPQPTEVVVRQGQWVAGVLHGSGMQKDETGSYVGDFVEGTFEGRGTMTYADGKTYEGQWLQGEPHGTGTLRERNQFYTGEWVNGVKTGFGKSGDIREDYLAYEGEFLDGEYHGQGIRIMAGNYRHTGEFKNGKPDGYGERYSLRHTMSQWDGSEWYYKGEWQDGLYHGKGVFYDTNRAAHHSDEAPHTYEGEFARGKYHGEGVQTIYGTLFEGTFFEGSPVDGNFSWNGRVYLTIIQDGADSKYAGVGRYVTADGKVFENVMSLPYYADDFLEGKYGLYRYSILMFLSEMNLADPGENIYEAYHPDGRSYRGTYGSPDPKPPVPAWLSSAIGYM